MWGGDQLSRGRRPESGCELALLDPQVACEFGNVAAQMSDMGLDIRFWGARVTRTRTDALHLLVDDVDKVWQRALDAGAEVFRPLQDSF